MTAVKVEAKDTPIVFEFVGQTQGSHTVEIRARVDGFLDKRMYTEGSVVQKGQTMFLMDPKPFEARLNAAVGALSQQEARLRTAEAELRRVKPLVEQNALSQKDLDDATGQQQAAAAAVVSAVEVEQTNLNLGYTKINAPLTGLSSYARVQEGSYVNPMNSLLTYVVQISPMWVTFSISENDILRSTQSRRLRDGPPAERIRSGDHTGRRLGLPAQRAHYLRGARVSQQTGTFLLRATVPNPNAKLHPGQFVRACVMGLVRPNAIAVPQRAVQQGAKGHFVWTIDKHGTVEPRPVTVGDWIGNDWFISTGLNAGDTVVVDGGLTLAAGDPATVKTWLTPTVERRKAGRRTAARSPEGRRPAKRASLPRPRNKGGLRRPHVLQVFHRAANLRDGHLSYHRDRRAGGDESPACGSIPDDHACTGPGQRHVSRRGLEDGGRLRGGPYRGTDQRRRTTCCT